MGSEMCIRDSFFSEGLRNLSRHVRPLSLVQTSNEVDQRETVTNQQSTEMSSEQGESYLILNEGSCEGDFRGSRRSTGAKPIFNGLFPE